MDRRSTRDRSESGFRVSGATFASGGIDAKSGIINVQIASLRRAEELKWYEGRDASPVPGLCGSLFSTDLTYHINGQP